MSRSKPHAVQMKWLGVAAVVSLLAGCPAMTTARLQLEFSLLKPLGADFVYEGWLIVDGAHVSTGRFTVDENGTAVPAEFDVDATDADAATMFVLTIEPADDADPAPANMLYRLAGGFDRGTAVLGVLVAPSGGRGPSPTGTATIVVE